MTINDLKCIRKWAPCPGQMLLYTRNEKVCFHPYASLEDVINKCKANEDGFLELHLFDESKEYRAIKGVGRAASKNKAASENDGIIEYLADFPCDDASSVFSETLLLENPFVQAERKPGEPSSLKKMDTITVLNHIAYDETGLATIDDYRMVMGVNNHD